MQHNLVRILLAVERIPLTPIIAHRISKDIAIAIEVRGTDRSADLRVSLKPVLCVFVPEVECAV